MSTTRTVNSVDEDREPPSGWSKFWQAFGEKWKGVPAPIRKPAIVVAAVILLGIGGVLSILPGPFTIPFIIGAFALLSTEFEWAHRLMKWSERKLIVWKEWLLELPRWMLVAGVFVVAAGFGSAFYWWFFLRT